MPDSQGDKRLVLHVEVPGVYADDLPQAAAFLSEPHQPTPQDYLDMVLEEWMRPEVGLTIVTLPGLGEMSEDFEVHAYTGRIVGVEVRPIDEQATSDTHPNLSGGSAQ